jgi:hypothetical protein
LIKNAIVTPIFHLFSPSYKAWGGVFIRTNIKLVCCFSEFEDGQKDSFISIIYSIIMHWLWSYICHYIWMVSSLVCRLLEVSTVAYLVPAATEAKVWHRIRSSAATALPLAAYVAATATFDSSSCFRNCCCRVRHSTLLPYLF